MDELRTNCGSSGRLFEVVACPSSLADLDQIVLLGQLLHMHLNGVAICFAPSIRVDDPTLSIVAVRLSVVSFSGASVSMTAQRP